MPTARTATVSVATYEWLSFTLKSSAELLVFISAVHAAMALTRSDPSTTVVIKICAACGQPVVYDL